MLISVMDMLDHLLWKMLCSRGASSVEKLGDRVMIGRRGSLNLQLTVNGRQGHVAYPHRVDNPIHRMSRAGRS